MVTLCGSRPVFGEEKPVVDEILDILRRGGQIDDKKYEELREKAKSEHPPGHLEASWKNGLRFYSTDGNFDLRVGGRVDNPWGIVEASHLDQDFGIAATPAGVPANQLNNLDDVETGTEFRRARLYVGGTMYRYTEFRAEFDFAGGTPKFRDVWLGLRNIDGVPTIKVGHFKEPFSLEELTSSRFMTFIERGLPTVFVPSRNTGISAQQMVLDERMTWAVGGFHDADDFGNGFGRDSTYNVTSRLTGLPWYEKDGDLVHLGLSYSHQFRNHDAVRYRGQAETSLGNVDFVDTRLAVLDGTTVRNVDISSDGVDLINPEVAVVVGPFSAQGEYVHSIVDQSAGSGPDFYGLYVYASYFLTGERRPYKREEAAFDRITPIRSFLEKGGWGAWELAARYSRVDLDSSGVRGGKLDDVTLALNWYVNPNVRVMLNYVHAVQEELGSANIVQTNFHVDF